MSHPVGRNLDRAIEGGSVEEVYTSKKYFDKLPNAQRGPIDTPVIEKALGSTKQLGTYRTKPVYSHGTPGKGEDDIYLVGSEGSKGWIDG